MPIPTVDEVLKFSQVWVPRRNDKKTLLAIMELGAGGLYVSYNPKLSYHSIHDEVVENLKYMTGFNLNKLGEAAATYVIPHNDNEHIIIQRWIQPDFFFTHTEEDFAKSEKQMLESQDPFDAWMAENCFKNSTSIGPGVMPVFLAASRSAKYAKYRKDFADGLIKNGQLRIDENGNYIHMITLPDGEVLEGEELEKYVNHSTNEAMAKLAGLSMMELLTKKMGLPKDKASALAAQIVGPMFDPDCTGDCNNCSKHNNNDNNCEDNDSNNTNETPILFGSNNGSGKKLLN